MVNLPLLLDLKYMKPGTFDNVTFMSEYDHPVLEVGSSQCILKDEVREWCDACIGHLWSFGIHRGTYNIWFDDDAAATMFILRWL